MMKEMRIYSCTCTGICDHTDGAIEEARKWEPDFIAAQGGSADGGAAYMGPTYVRSAGDLRIKRQFEAFIGLAAEFNIPFCLGIGGMSGTDLRVDHDLRLLDEVLREKDLKLRIAVVSGEISKEYLMRKLEEGLKIKRLGRYEGISEYLLPEDVDRSSKIVAQMGPEPMTKALSMDVDGVVTGRSLDLAHHMSLPLMKGFDKGIAAQLAKVIECGAMCAHPCIIRPVLGTLRKDHFLVTPADPEQKCTVLSVADHTFYERRNPFLEENPGGILDLTEAEYEQYDERTVKGWGGKWKSQPYTVKLEGATLAGYETIAILGIRDPIHIRHIDSWLDRIKARTDNKFSDIRNSYQLFFHVYGKDGVLGDLETQKKIPHEIVILVEVIAETQDMAHSICVYTDHAMKTQDFPGHLRQINSASPAKQRIDCGPLYIFHIWHLLPLDGPCEPFQIRVMDFPRDG